MSKGKSCGGNSRVDRFLPVQGTAGKPQQTVKTTEEYIHSFYKIKHIQGLYGTATRHPEE